MANKAHKDLTKKQEETLQFIKKYMVAHGFPPSVREICAGMGLSSPATAHTHLKELESKGFIRKQNSKFRTIELLVENEFEEKDTEDVVSVPLLGKVACGNPIEAIENPNEYFRVTKLMSDPDYDFGYELRSVNENDLYDSDLGEAKALVCASIYLVAHEGSLKNDIHLVDIIFLKNYHEDQRACANWFPEE